MVLHHTGMASAAAALDRLCDPAAEVSAHWLIGRDGTVWSLVPEDRRAWHAGAGAWGEVTDVNSASVGIELQNCGDQPYPAPQVAALEALLDGIMARWAIPPEGVIGHADMAPGRKADPGRRFPWARLARGGRAVWPGRAGRAPADPARFAAAAIRFGYRAPGGDMGPVLAAFRLRFRPRAAGPLAGRDVALIEALAERWPAH